MKRSFIPKPFIAVFLAGVFYTVQAAAQSLSGVYTIDPAQPLSATNFQSFSAAVAALDANGISAAVTFNVAVGTYNEQVLLNTITGSSAANTITFVGGGATISANPVNPNSRAIIKLNGTDYVHIQDLNITATGGSASEYGYGIQLMNGADHNSITGCTINTTKSSDGSATPNYAGIVINSSDGAVLTQGDTKCDDNTIQGNMIAGGYYGIALVAQATTYTISNNKILDNDIRDFYRTGIYMNGTVNTRVDNNDISRPDRPGNSFFQYFGMNIEGANSGLQVTRNKLHDPFGENAAISSSSAYAFYINGSAGSADAVNLFANNIIYNMGSNGIVGGFDITSSPYNTIVNNTVCVDHASSTAFGFTKGISIIGANNQNIYNNNISIKRGGLGAKHCIYVGNTSGSSINSNNYHLGTGTSGYIGYFASANRATLADWQTASGFDGSAVSVDPQFISAGTGNLLPANTALQAGAPVASTGISTDINGLGRSATTPTMGAFEINGVVLPVTMSALRASLDGQNQAHLSWSTFTEMHNAGFKIEKSADGKSWTCIGFVATKAMSGNSTDRIEYRFSESLPLNNVQYYRLQQLDLDGKTSFSNTVVLNPGKAGAGISVGVYPNPAQDVLKITLAGTEAATGNMVITDLQGKQVMAVPVAGTNAELPIAHLTPGIYHLRYHNNGEQRIVKFVKSK